MSSNISAKTLFHFTQNSENLINILIDGFYPRCCMENLEFIYKQGVTQLIQQGLQSLWYVFVIFLYHKSEIM